MTYRPGQARNVFPFAARMPRWLLLGGPADGDEAQCFRLRWPGLRVVGVEPCAAMREWQLANGWEGPLIPAALGARPGTATLYAGTSGPRGTSLMPERGGQSSGVPVTTWDALDLVHGPFLDAVLWLDVEGAEADALDGAEGLFASGRVLLVNVEILGRLAENRRRIEAFFDRHGFRLARTWNVQGDFVEDRVYVPEYLRRLEVPSQ